MATTSARRAWPVLGWLPNYRPGRLGHDGLGALTAWALVVPESVAYAQIAGVPPQAAFYAAPVALLAYAVVGSSAFLVVGATSAASVLSAATVGEVSTDPALAMTLSAGLAILAGLGLAAAGIARLGFIADFLSPPVLTGFLFGMACTIIVRQLGKITGVSTGDGDFFQRLGHLLAHITDWSLTTLAVGAASIAALALLSAFVPRVPASLVVLVGGIAVSAGLHLDRHGVDIVGHIPSAVPTPAWPDLTGSQWTGLGAGAAGLALVVFAESYSIAADFARAHNQDVDANREMAAMGVVNLAVGLFRGFTVSGSASRSAAVQDAGGGSPMVSVIAAVLVLITAAFLTPVFTDLPEPVLGAIVIVAVRSFLRVGELRRYARADRRSCAAAATALLGVLVFDLLPGLLLAVAVSLLLFLAAVSRPRVAVLGRLPAGTFGDVDGPTPGRPVAGLLVLRPDAELFFGNAHRVALAVRARVAAAAPAPRVVVLELGSSYRLSLPVQDELADLVEDVRRDSGAEVWFARVRQQAVGAVTTGRLGALVGPERVHPDVETAAAAFADRRDSGRPPAVPGGAS